MYDIIMVGGGTAGMTAALYARRAGKTALIIEGETFGGQITKTQRVENIPGILAIGGSEYANQLLEQTISLGAEVSLDRVKEVKEGDCFTVVGEDAEYECRAVVLCSGVKHRTLGLKNEERLIGAGISYCAVCDGAFFKNRPVAVIGGGNTALADAIFLSAFCEKVYLIHRRDEFRGEQSLVERLKRLQNVEFVLNAIPIELCGEEYVEGIVVEDNATKEKKKLAVDGIFVAVGQIPDNAQFAELVALDDWGYIKAGEDTKTSKKGVFAAGDCRTKEVRQLITAAADGAVAAVAACKYIDEL